jgi:hypothetical protein
VFVSVRIYQTIGQTFLGVLGKRSFFSCSKIGVLVASWLEKSVNLDDSHEEVISWYASCFYLFTKFALGKRSVSVNSFYNLDTYEIILSIYLLTVMALIF